VNQSWAAVEPLHNTIIAIDPLSKPVADDGRPISVDDLRQIRAIHISALQIPVSYDAVFDIVPGLHARPPVLPKSDTPFPPLPDRAYDFIFHVGVADRGPLRVERLGHKSGYYWEDVDGKLAPIVQTGGDDVDEPPNRGFGPGYETFPDDLATDIDVTKLEQDMKRSGIEVRRIPGFTRN
jgi:hypothetical protein